MQVANRQGNQESSRIFTQASLVGPNKELKDDRSHADADVEAYSQAVAGGAKFVEQDARERSLVEDAEVQLDSPYAMGLDKTEFE